MFLCACRLIHATGQVMSTTFPTELTTWIILAFPLIFFLRRECNHKVRIFLQHVAWVIRPCLKFSFLPLPEKAFYCLSVLLFLPILFIETLYVFLFVKYMCKCVICIIWIEKVFGLHCIVYKYEIQRHHAIEKQIWTVKYLLCYVFYDICYWRWFFNQF